MRLEYKFLVKNRYLADLHKALQPYVELDPYALQRENNEYTVRSIYFDTTGLRYYHEKLAGIKFRKKIRIRGYNEFNVSNRVFLEIKRKHENYISKSRTQIRFVDVEHFFNTRDSEAFVISNKPEASSRQFLYYINGHNLKPTVLVVYDREAYYSGFNSNLRITIDKNLRFFGFPELSELYEEDKLQSALNGYFILEIKFSRGFPHWLQAIIRDFGLARQALSKYTICLDAQKNLYPEARRSILPFSRAIPVYYAPDPVRGYDV